LGVAADWQVTAFDPKTLQLTVSWGAPGQRGPGGAQGDGTATLTLNLGNASASGPFQGQIFTTKGTKTISGTWSVTFHPAANTKLSGTVDGAFTGTASYVGNVSGKVSGSWTASVLPNGTITGGGTGTYNGGNLSVSSYGTVCICGTWSATLQQAANGQYQLVGAWTHPVVSGTLDGNGGGPVSWTLNLATVPMQATGDFSGQTNFPVTVPFLGAITVGVDTNGSWTATLPVNN
jgi:autotransporter translocation and assembly factor TamB